MKDAETMDRIAGKSRRRRIFGGVALAVTVGLVILYFVSHPKLPPNVVRVECQWRDREHRHVEMMKGATTDLAKIDKIVKGMKAGRPYARPFSKVNFIAVLRLEDASGSVQQWTFYMDGSIGCWDTEMLYYVGKDFEKVLQDTVPPPAI